MPMPQSPNSILDNPAVRATLYQAWRDSNPGLTGGHEEGGFILQDQAQNLSIVRWPGGAQNSIHVPPHPNCKIGEQNIVASFHTHPNTGNDYLQEPGETDKRAVQDDPELKGTEYIGEFVISQTIIYLITPAGQVREMGDTPAVLSQIDRS
jgi:hypothetical protein